MAENGRRNEKQNKKQSEFESEFVVEARSLTKKFNGFTAVNAIDLSVRRGEVFGLLGPNGAGKSTTMYMLSTILAPSSGSAVINGFDAGREPIAVRRSIGMVFQDSTLDTNLTGFDNLDIHGRLYGMNGAERGKKITEVLELVELADWRGKLVKTYSGGMKRRLEIARGLLHTPTVLFLDEPTLGLDAQTRRHIWDYLRKLRAAGVTMILTTHYLEEADELCDRVAIIDHGEIKALGSPDELKRQAGETVVYLKTSGAQKQKQKLLAALKKKNFAANAIEGGVAVKCKSCENAIPALLRAADSQKIPVDAVEMRKPSLEDVFLSYTGRSLRDAGASGAEARRAAATARGFRHK